MLRGQFHAAACRLVNLLLPPQCVLCGSDTDLPTEMAVGFCDSCQKQLSVDSSPRCLKCAARVPHLEPMPDCRWCREHQLRFDRAMVLNQYDGMWREVVLAMKRASGDPVTLTVAKCMWETHGETLRSEKPNWVLGVPLHWSRRWHHGTNSAMLLAEQLARQLGARCPARGICRRRRTVPQGELPPAERRRNVAGAFGISRRIRWQGSCVLLVDDVLTTGATLSELAGRLKKAGVRRVVVATVTRAEGGM